MSRSTEAKRARREEARIEREAAWRRETQRKWLRSAAVGIGVVAALSLLGWFVVAGGGSALAYSGDIRPGGHLERLTLPALEGSGSIDYADYRGKPLVINFFASWCPSCIAEMPDFEQVHQELDGKVAFIGISQQDASGASIELARQTGITYPAGIDAAGRFFNATGSQGMPVTIFVRSGGEIAHIQQGALDADSLRQSIQAYLGV
ncbi:MAG: TlpA disulfide reductase family protein [Actinomycetota bacterium]